MGNCNSSEKYKILDEKKPEKIDNIQANVIQPSTGIRYYVIKSNSDQMYFIPEVAYTSCMAQQVYDDDPEMKFYKKPP